MSNPNNELIRVKDEPGTSSAVAGEPADEAERGSLQQAEKRAQRKLLKRTQESMEIDASLLSGPSTELLGSFSAFLTRLLDAKGVAGPLHCYQIVLNSLSSLHSKQYPELAEKELQNMNNSLLLKLFQKIAVSNNDDFEIELVGPDADESRTRSCCELLCLLEMHLLRFPGTTTTYFNQQQDQKGTAALKLQMTHTQMATRKIATRLRRLYFMCTNPEHFSQFLDETLCDEFLEDLPFYLAAIYEQLAVQVPAELRTFRSQENREQEEDDDEFSASSNGRPLRLDLRPHKNRQMAKLEQFLRRIEEDEKEDNNQQKNKDDQKENEFDGNKNCNKKKKTNAGNKRKKAEKQQSQEEESSNQLIRPPMGAPKKGQQQLTTTTQLMKGTDKASFLARLKRSPLKLGDLQSLSRRRILHQLLPQTPEKEIAQRLDERQKRRSDIGEAAEVVEQTPIGKIRGEDSTLTSKLAELLLREEFRMRKFRDFIEVGVVKVEELDTPIASSQLPTSSKTNKEIGNKSSNNQFPMAMTSINTKMASASGQLWKPAIITEKAAAGTAGIGVSREKTLPPPPPDRKRPLTPSSVTADLLQLKLQQQQQQMVKRPKRRLFSPSKSSTKSSSSLLSFPFTTGSAPTQTTTAAADLRIVNFLEKHC